MKRLRYNRVIIITLVVAALSLVIGWYVLAMVRQQLVKTTTEDYKKQQAILADQVVETLSNNLVNLENQLQLMATMPEVQDIDDTERCIAKLTQLLAVNQKQLGNLARTDTSGRFACSVNRDLIGQETARYGTYVNDLIADPTHKPVLGRMTRPQGANSLAAGPHVPVYVDGEFRGTLGGAVYFSRFQDAYLKSIEFGRTGHVVIMDDNADILYHPSPAQNGQNLLDPKTLAHFEPEATMRNLVKQVKAGESGTFDYKLDGTPKTGLWKAFPVPETNRHWAAIVTIPDEDIEGVINDAGINRILPLLYALFTATVALLTFIGLRNILKNLELQKMKDDFISITSHQLRTPATIVKQNLGLIRGGFVTDPKDVTRFINSAYESNENQLNIIENILSVSRLEAGRLELQKEEVVLQDIVREVTDIMKTGLVMKKQKLKVALTPKPIRLQADPTKLAMTVENLISNASKYSAPGDKITVAVSTASNMAVVEVEDTGKGIAPEDIPKVFQRFNRLHSALVSHVPGTGLGLYLAKQIAELHGGTITVTSKVGKGSIFTINLPLQ